MLFSFHYGIELYFIIIIIYRIRVIKSNNRHLNYHLPIHPSIPRLFPYRDPTINRSVLLRWPRPKRQRVRENYRYGVHITTMKPTQPTWKIVVVIPMVISRAERPMRNST